MRLNSSTTISSVPKDGKPRPFWSVMIPTYNPPLKYLEQALQGVLAQDPGREQMQIEVVDDCSPDVDVAAAVRQIAGDRVICSRTPQNLGLAGCWNTCVERSRGEWVHILHQDDMVLPGFYVALGKAALSDEKIGAVVCRLAFVDPDGHWLDLSDIIRKEPGVIEDWLERLGSKQLIQTPSIVVRRSVYELIGGFRSDLCFTLDWEMWLRIATRFSFWYEPRILANYRVHDSSETSKLLLEASDTRDCRKMIELTQTYQPPHLVSKVTKNARTFYAELAIQNARRLLVLRHRRSAWKQVVEAFRLSKRPRICWLVLSFFSLWGRLLGSYAKQFLRRRFGSTN
jgi:glycosyltransferase involved in cell wall biosynthesis